jgi:hypothetical protein
MFGDYLISDNLLMVLLVILHDKTGKNENQKLQLNLDID